jgi:hypothetical protein
MLLIGRSFSPLECRVYKITLYFSKTFAPPRLFRRLLGNRNGFPPVELSETVMNKKKGSMAAMALLGLTLACSNSDKERAKQDQARAQAEMRKLGAEAKQQAGELRANVDHALQPGQTNSASGAEAKLRHGGEELRSAGDKAGVKLNHAALIAQVKAKLASDVGLSTLTSVDVDSSGHTVTLHGTVASEAQRTQAEQAVSQIDGITKVEDANRSIGQVYGSTAFC